MRRALAGAVACLALAVPALALGEEIRVPGDHRRLQDALDAAGPGDTVVLVRGVHRGTFVLEASGVVLEARKGRIARRRGKRTPGQVEPPALTVRGDGVSVRGVVFQGAALEVSGDDARVEGCRFRNMRKADGDQMMIVRGNRAVVRGNDLEGHEEPTHAGIRVEGDDAVVEDNRILHPDRPYGVYAEGRRARVAGNQLELRTVGGGIRIEGDDAVVERNRLVAEDLPFSFSTHGILVNGDGALVGGNEVAWVEGGCPPLLVQGSGGAIEDNRVATSSQTGIIVRGDGNRIAGNRVEGPPDDHEFAHGYRAHGIAVRGGGNRVEGNTVTGVPGGGIRIAGTDGNAIAGCLVDGAVAYAFGNWAEGSVVSGCTFGSRGIDVVNAGSFALFEEVLFETGDTRDGSAPYSDRTYFDQGTGWGFGAAIDGHSID